MKNCPNVLVVDDEAGPREAIRQMLKGTYGIATAGDGEEALVKLYKQNFDVVTLDLKMPGMQGIDILKAIKTYDSNIEVVVVTGFSTLETARDAIRFGAFDYVSKPYDVKEFSRVIEKSLRRRRMNMELKNMVKELQFPEEVINDNETGHEPNIVKKAKSFIQNYASKPESTTDEEYLDFIRVLARTLEMKDSYTHGHSDRVNYYTRLIAERMNLESDLCADIQRASFLHDIGKLGISDEILHKKEPLSPSEWEIIRAHPKHGVEMIEPLYNSQGIIPIILHHHEKYDGSGYPYGLKEEDIPFGSRIICIVDSYDAMTSHRPYSKAKTRKEAVAELKNCSGTHFDPSVVNIFTKILLEEETHDTHEDNQKYDYTDFKKDYTDLAK